MAYRVSGFRAAGVSCGIKRPGTLDLALIVSERPTLAAGVFTRNRFPGAPVVVSREHLRGGRARAVVVNSGSSNVANGTRGLRDARRMAEVTAEELELPTQEVQVASTGVIGRPLPISRLEHGIRDAVGSLSPLGWTAAARAILTTDTRPKLVLRRSRSHSILGIAKGSGMLMPDLATMLVFLVTDATPAPALLRRTLREAAEATFNRLTIDGETSTSDTVLLLANGASGRASLAAGSRGGRGFARDLLAVCEALAEKLVADGEGATRVAEILVRGAGSDALAERVARRVANSVLVKTALFGADPNWGRIVQAVGAAGVPLRPEQVSIRIGGVRLLHAGAAVRDPSALRAAARAMRRRRVRIEIGLGRGRGRSRMLTCDLGYGYVRINAEYTT
ncbi:MAG: bifunctional glutamate N-acetyltransferase/amino-acid acetyltransferase ArgJ [Myxococcota bacterium]